MINNSKNYIKEKILSLAINKDEKVLACITNQNRIHKIDLNKSDLDNKIAYFNVIKNFHYTKITSLDVCTQRPLIVTCAVEKVIKIWNYENATLELNKIMDENLFSVSIHPSGLYLAVSIFNKINLYEIYFNEIKCIKTLEINKLSSCRFSYGGQYLGLIAMNSIKNFNFWTYEISNEFKFRNGKIEDFEWFNNDQHIACCTNMGVVCIWDVFTGQKLCEYTEKMIQFKRLQTEFNQFKLMIFISDKSNNIRILSSKHKDYTNNNKNFLDFDNIEDLVLVRLIEWIKLPFNSKLTSFVKFKNYLICGTEKGHLFHINVFLNDNSFLPVAYDNENDIKNFYQDFNQSICIDNLKLISNLNGFNLLSCSEDGLLIFSNFSLISTDVLSNTAYNASRMTFVQQINNFSWLDDILLTKNDIRKCSSNDFNLRQSLNEYEDEKNYQLKLKDILHKELTKTINYEAKLNLTRLRTLLKEVKIIKDEQLTNNSLKYKLLKSRLENDTEFIKSFAESELGKIYQENDKLCQEKNLLLKLSETLNENISKNLKGESKSKNVDVYKNYKSLDYANERNSKINKMKNEINILNTENVIMEKEMDKYILDFKLNNQKELNHLNENNESIKLEICLIKRQLTEIKENLYKIKEESQLYDDSYLGERKKFLLKNDYVECLKKISADKEEKLQTKEKRINHLKRSLDCLKKLKFINEYQVNKLENSIEPIKTENDSLKELKKINEEKLDSNLNYKILILRTAIDSATRMKKLNQAKIFRIKSTKSKVNRLNQKIIQMVEKLTDLIHSPNILLDLLFNLKRYPFTDSKIQ